MSATATAEAGLEAFRAAVTRKDYDALERCYAEDAVVISYSERNRPSSADVLRGRQAIVAAYREAPPDLEHELTDVVSGEDGFAFTLKCTYPTGELVLSAAICNLRDGLITRQTGVEAWDE